MTRTTVVGVLAACLLIPTGSAAQAPPRASVVAGFGNAFGWIGAQVEGYAMSGRVSAFGGFGFMPNLLNDEGNTAAGAIGIRAFTPGMRHRGLVELSVSALSNETRSTFGGDRVEKSVGYGPGVALGYQFIGDSGLTVLLSGGVALAGEGSDPEGSRVRPTVGMGVGLTVR